jgi:hypothetical protein
VVAVLLFGKLDWPQAETINKMTILKAMRDFIAFSLSEKRAQIMKGS